MNMKKYVICFLTLCLIFSTFQSCVDEAGDDNYTTFEDDLVLSFLEKDPDNYSEFIALLYATGMNDLMNAYGYYTCFVPTNKALREYYEENGLSFESLSDQEKKSLVYDHLIKGKSSTSVYYTSRFLDKSLPTPTMSDQFILAETVSEGNTVQIYLNKISPITIPDQKVHNGVIHTIGKVLPVSKILLPDAIAHEENYSWFSRALQETGMADSLRLENNDRYDATRALVDPAGTGIKSKAGSQTGRSPVSTPDRCRIQYTVLIESDETYRKALSAAGFGTEYSDLKRLAASIYDRIYPAYASISDVTDRRNSFNRFISYHLLDRKLESNEIFGVRLEDYKTAYIQKTYSEIIETMCPNTLMEIRPDSITKAPVFNKRTTNPEDGVRIIAADKVAKNGVYHEIDKVLTFEGIDDVLLSKRIRIDAASLLPELASNKLRSNWGALTNDGNGWIMPQNYFKNLSYTPETEMQYWGSDGGNPDMEGDELLFVGKYDFTLRLPPLPAATYEVRIGYTANTKRGVAQIFFDNKPCGIPLNMTVEGESVDIGWVDDKNLTPEAIIENDKMLRNRTFMKGPDGATYPATGTPSLRTWKNSLRKILLVTTVTKVEPHFLRVKSVEERLDREFMLDWIEFVPSRYWEEEGVD
jgi:uncharacterized surface protein with fasciclin (FAS1) repeats